MKAMVLRKFNHRMSLEDVEDPRPGPFDIVLRVTACGVCGTDLKIVSGMLPPSIITLPHIPGHEIAGEVVEIGSAVEEVTPGETGIAYFYLVCRDCEMCRTGRENVCLSVRRLGFELDGGFAEFVKLPAYNFCPFDGNMPSHQMAVLSDAVATSYHALRSLALVKGGQDVLVVGSGGLGIHAVQIGKLMGARIIAVDRRNDALNLARDLGAEWIINCADQDPMEAVMELTRGRGVDAVIENVGSEETLKWSLHSLKRGGRLILVGYEPDKTSPLPTMAMHYNEWIISGARLSTKQELLEVIALVQGGRIRPVISKTRGWVEVNEAITALQREEAVGRTVLTFPVPPNDS
jgi:propanol-preferring alcohol dehydrogenase